jgi:DNA-binding NtrC family response regulator
LLYKKCMHKLNARERTFFSLVSRAAFANPFSPERAHLDLAITGQSESTPLPRRLDSVIKAVDAAVDKLKDRGRANINLFPGNDRLLVQHTLLFAVYHRLRDSFCKLIETQAQSGATPCTVSFAAQALQILREYGFTHEEACRYFALFYQMRRAFYFIDQDLVGTSPCMQQLRLDLWNNVFTYDIGLYEKYLWNRMEDFSTLLLGETGTGKGTAAAAIGRSIFIPYNDKRRCFTDSFTRLFIPLNLSQFSEALIESELFGHKKGAFTGAVEEHTGILEQCGPHSSIFLDEIGEVAVSVQIKLLQVLQERQFSRVGCHDRLRFQGRVIAATNRTIDDLRSSGAFRDDFFYRLCSDSIVVPPLRQRLQEDPAELDSLLAHVIQRMVGKPSSELTEITRNVILKRLGKSYHWPGNVRELEQCVRRILLKRDYAGDRRAIDADEPALLTRHIASGTLDAKTLLSRYCILLHKKYGSFEEVARRTNLDRRTVKKYITSK